MRSPALALCWHLWRPHRWGIALFLSYLLGLCVAARWVADAAHPPADVGELLGAASIPLLLGLLYLMAVFAHPEADVAAARSGYPSHLLLLPVRTRDLVLWPMLSGTGAVALGWIVLARLILSPVGVVVPTGWPAVMIAALLAALQALFWSPLGLPYLRVALALTIMPGLLAVGYWGGVLHGTSPEALTAFYLCLISSAYLAAVFGLTRARHGGSDRAHVSLARHLVAKYPASETESVKSERMIRNPGHREETVPDFLVSWIPHRRLPFPFRAEGSLWDISRSRDEKTDAAAQGSCRSRPFASPARAQLWFEWRSSGVLLLLLVAGAGLFFTLPLIAVREQAPLGDLLLPPLLFAPGAQVIQANVCLKGQQYALFIPPLFALIIGCGLRKEDRRNRDRLLPPFLATRPMSSGDLALAQLKMAGLSTLVAWIVLLLFAGAWFLLPARDGALTGPLLWLLLRHGTARSGLILLLGLAGLIGWTWKSQVQTLFADLTGRRWSACAYPLAVAGQVTALLLLTATSADPELFVLALPLVPLLLACLAARAWIVYGYPIGAAGLTLSLLLFLKLIHSSHGQLMALRDFLPVVAALALASKLLAAAAALLFLRQSRLIDARALTKLLLAWLVLAAAAFVLLRISLPAAAVPSRSLAAAVPLLLPLTQLLLAPLALASHRHR